MKSFYNSNDKIVLLKYVSLIKYKYKALTIETPLPFCFVILTRL